jgi:hypothetical protein
LPVKGADGKTQTVAELIEGHDLTEYGLEEGARVHQALKLKPVTI